MSDLYANVDASIALRMLITCGMRPFDKDDWSAFAGCESSHPMIGEYKSILNEDFVVVLDGDTVLVLHEADEYGGRSYKLSEARS
jgi:hypothetical protein